MKRQLTKFAIYAVAILSATLINGAIIDAIKKHITLQGYQLVLIDMAVVVLIFAPAFAIVSKYTKKLSSAYIKTSKKVSNNTNGVLLGFIAALLILFVLFAYLRHHINSIQHLKLLFLYIDYTSMVCRF